MVNGHLCLIIVLHVYTVAMNIERSCSEMIIKPCYFAIKKSVNYFKGLGSCAITIRVRSGSCAITIRVRSGSCAITIRLNERFSSYEVSDPHIV